jgi:hypothetical protein
MAVTPQVWTGGTFRGEIPLLKWVYQSAPRTDFALFLEGSEVYIPVSIGVSNTNATAYKGQVFLKVGDL